MSGRFDPSTENNQRLMSMYREGVSGVVIAERLGLTPSAVRSRIWAARKMGLLESYQRAQREDSINLEILDLYNEGAPYDDIAAQLGVSRTFVNSRIRMLRSTGKIVGERVRGLKKGYVPRPAKEAAFNERLRLELIEQHRREFLDPRSIYVPQTSDSTVYPDNNITGLRFGKLTSKRAA